jgi:putative oxidoreductase
MNPNMGETLASLGLLVLRLGAGGLLFYGHGMSKLMGFSQRAGRFSDPLGVGSPASLALAVFAEVLCALLVVLGLGTRIAALILVGFFGVLFFIHHAQDPFRQKELSIVYLIPFLTLVLTGPGRLSLDAWLAKRFSRST